MQLVWTASGLVASLVAALTHEIRTGMLPADAHLAAQQIADRFAVSRSPVTEALRSLVASGLARHEANKGYFVNAGGHQLPEALPPTPQDAVELAYRRLAEDRLENRVPVSVSTAFIKERYGLTQGQLQALLTRVVKEGWVQRRAGYGISFTDMLNTADALAQSYNMRMALEPAALLEPGYDLDRKVAAELRRVEEFMLAGGIETMTAEALYDRGVGFHEGIVGASRNPFYLDALQRINSIRRLLAYRSMTNRERYYEQARDHLEILALLEEGRNEEASWKLRSHIGKVIHNLASIRPLLEPPSDS